MKNIAFVLLLSCVAHAAVTRVVVEQKESPAFAGKSFGKAGQFEILSGHFYGELDPRDSHNTIITDIQLAPRNARGMVEYAATFAIAKPIDMSKSSGVLFYSVPNRGNGAPNGSDEGHVSVVSGWQGDLVPRAGLQTIVVPTAAGITGPVSERLINAPANSNTLALDKAAYVALTYQRPATLDTSKATLAANGKALAPGDWAFADCTSTPFPGAPDPTKICAKNGFDSGTEYIVSYIAKDPLVLGIGFAATRDFNSYLRYSDRADNPVAKQIKWGVSRGSSQSGNFLRSYINLGFNQDEAGRIVWDGANPHIAARQLVLNIRFAAAGGAAGPNEPGSEGTLWWNEYDDAARHRGKSSLLARCTATKTCPKIFETFGSLEFWYLRESPNLVGTDAKRDIPLPENVRRYYLPATTHGGGTGGFHVEGAAAPNGCVLPANPNPESDTMRALTVALVDWTTKGVAPPPSRYPRLDRGELVPATKIVLGVPGMPEPPAINALIDYDFGADFHYADVSGVISKQPPATRQVLPSLVPKADADGMDAGGVASILRQAPLGTYLGWNITASGVDKGKQCGLNGGYVPFAKTKAVRLAAGDPRPSLEERYGSHTGYVEAVRQAAVKAVSERFLLQSDADRLVMEAAMSNVLLERVPQ